MHYDRHALYMLASIPARCTEAPAQPREPRLGLVLTTLRRDRKMQANLKYNWYQVSASKYCPKCNYCPHAGQISLIRPGRPDRAIRPAPSGLEHRACHVRRVCHYCIVWPVRRVRRGPAAQPCVSPSPFRIALPRYSIPSCIPPRGQERPF